MINHDLRIPAKRSPLVYAWINAADEVLYVGMSRRGLGRPFSFHHQVIKPSDSDSIIIWYCHSEQRALELEGQLIRLYLPPHNSNGSTKARKLRSDHYFKPSQIYLDALNDLNDEF